MKNFKLILLTTLCLSSVASHGQSSLDPLPGDESLAPIKKETARGLPGDKAYPDINEQIEAAKKAMKEAFEKEMAKATQPPPARQTASSSKRKEKETKVREEPTNTVTEQPSKTKVVNRRRTRLPKRNKGVFIESSGVTIFTENFSEWEEEFIRVPALSSSYGTVLFGEEVTASEPDWVVARLDYAFLGPNGSVVELKGCRVDIDLTAKYHTQKVKGKLKKIVCRSPSGKVFEKDITGKIVDARNDYGGVAADFIMSGPAKAAALNSLDRAINAWGTAVSFTSSKREAVSNEYSTSEVSNATNKSDYIKGEVGKEAGSFFGYIAKFYESQEVPLAVAPGAKIHAYIRTELVIPYEFFKEKHNAIDVMDRLRRTE